MITELEFSYTGEQQSKILIPGLYKFEVWGAEGSVNGGKGGYATGYYNVISDTVFNIYVGGSGESGGFNGGAAGGSGKCGTGGGASDIRLSGTELTDRIIVAGGGGGGCSNGVTGGAGGGEAGEQGGNNGGAGGTRTTGPAHGNGTGGSSSSVSYDYDCTDATGSGYDILQYGYHYSGGGGGYFGGYGGLVTTTLARRHEHYPNDTTNSSTDSNKGAGGGSGFIHPTLFDTSMETGVYSGDGFIKITVENIKFFNMYIENKKIFLEPITDISNIHNIKIFINNEEIDVLEPMEEVIEFDLPDDKTNMGLNQITICVNASVFDLTDDFTFDIEYIKYGDYIPEDANLTIFKDYLNAMYVYTNNLRNEFYEILTQNSITVVDNAKITDMINIVKGIVEKVGGRLILTGMKPGNTVVINTGGSTTSGGTNNYRGWVLTSNPLTGLLPEGGTVRISWSVTISGGGTKSIEVIRNGEVIDTITPDTDYTGLQNGDVLRGTANATAAIGGVITAGDYIKVSYDYEYASIE